MTALAISLILASAVMHATWNLFSKRAGGGSAFIFCFSAVNAVVFAPIALASIWIYQPVIGAQQWLFIITSACLHIVYFTTLQRGYKVGDLSLVYPLARGTGPALSTIGAIALFGERPSWLVLFGTGLIVISVFLLSSSGSSLGSASQRAIGYGLFTGVIIACYTLVDKRAVSFAGIPPWVLDWCNSVCRLILITIITLGKRDEIKREWKMHRKEIFVVGILSPLSYIMVLIAMTFTPLTQVAPAREIGILFGAILGARLLSEGHTTKRLIAATGMVIGVVCLAIG